MWSNFNKIYENENGFVAHKQLVFNFILYIAVCKQSSL